MFPELGLKFLCAPGSFSFRVGIRVGITARRCPSTQETEVGGVGTSNSNHQVGSILQFTDAF